MELCFVAFGDVSFNGSGPYELIEGVRIVVLSQGRHIESPDQRGRWWESVYGPAWEKIGGREDAFWTNAGRDPRFNMWPDHGQQVRAAPETIAAAAAAVESVITGADGTAPASIKTSENYQFCAVHPDDGDLIAGCSHFDRQRWVPGSRRSLVDAVSDHEVTLKIYNPWPTRLPVFVYFSRGRAFFGLAADSGRYSRFLASDIHPPGTGRVTVAGFITADTEEYGLVYVPFDQERRQAVAVVNDEDIGEFWDAVTDGWERRLDLESPPTWAPATMLTTGADGTVTAELAAGDYLFCSRWSARLADCIYQDVTAGQDRILQPWNIEGQRYLYELTESESAGLLEAIAACETNPRPRCATREQYEHYKDTGEPPEVW